MFDFRRRIVPIILALVLAGCSDSTEPINLRVGLFVVDNVQLSALLHYPSRGMEEELGVRQYPRISDCKSIPARVLFC